MISKFKVTIACSSDNYYGIGKTPQEAFESLRETTEEADLYDTTFYTAELIQVELVQKPTLILKETKNVSKT